MAMSATIASPVALLSNEDRCLRQQKNVWSCPVQMKPISMHFQPLKGKSNLNRNFQVKHASLICAAALNATCAAEQTQTVTRESSTITVAPTKGEVDTPPELDDGGTGFPPRDDGDGGGGGGGGGGHWSGGFFFFGFLAFLGLLKDKESEGPYHDRRRR